MQVGTAGEGAGCKGLPRTTTHLAEEDGVDDEEEEDEEEDKKGGRPCLGGEGAAGPCLA